LLSENEIVLGQNFVWAVFGAAVALFYVIRCALGAVRGETFWLALGIVFVAGGSSAHRLYWYFGRWFRTQDNYAAWEWFSDHAAWGLSPVVIAIVAGYACHLMPLFDNKPVGAAFLFSVAFALWWIGAVLG